MKLSKAQSQVMEHLKEQIDEARNLEYPEWLKANTSYFNAPKWADDEQKKAIEMRFQNAVAEGYQKDWWEKHRDGIALVECNTRTLRKLEGFGLIEIIRDSTGEVGGIDIVKVLNY